MIAFCCGKAAKKTVQKIVNNPAHRVGLPVCIQNNLLPLACPEPFGFAQDKLRRRDEREQSMS